MLKIISDGVAQVSGSASTEEALADLESGPPVPWQQEANGRPPVPTATAAVIGDLDFGAAMQAAVRGQRVSRREWVGADVVFLRAGVLHLKKADGSEHVLSVSDGDILGADWFLR